MGKIDECPAELRFAIEEFWPTSEWENAAAISELESGWAFDAENKTIDAVHGCGDVLGLFNGVEVVAEDSIGYFQINACNLPAAWNPAHLFNARHNAGTAHDMWSKRGWSPWYFSAKSLGLL